MEDFSSVRKIDTHVHIRTDDPAFLEQAVQDNFRFVDIDVYKTEGPTVEEQRARAVKHLKAFPSIVSYATAFSTKNLESDDWQRQTIEFLKNSFAQGAIGVKVWKNIGMELKDRDNNFVMIDNPKFDPVFDFIAESKITLLSHQGEPRDCWLPLNEMTFHQGYYKEHPEYHMYLHPESPSYQDQINARDHMIAKHPDLKVVSVHMASLEWSVDELAKRLDKYPNMAVDMAARIGDLQFQVKNDRQKVYGFFIKYQDRLLYGTDIIVTESSDVANAKKSAHQRWTNDWRFFVTDDVISTSKFDVRGLKLPREVVDKIYRRNAETWLPGMAK
jgi:predicted TIM-barrel fold metal-dependent hydrolase